MTLTELVEQANKGYPDGFLTEYFDTKTGAQVEGSGDFLARFIVSELVETFTSTASADTQKAEAVRTLQRAIDDLQTVIDSIEARP